MAKNESKTNRRKFLKDSTLAAAATTVAASSIPSLANASGVHILGADTIKVGLIGCGGRGTGAVINQMKSKGNVELHSMADAFDGRLRTSLKSITKEHPAKVKVKEDGIHIGFDAYKRVLDSDIDMVILATPPGFRPLHFEKAVEAKKHVFLEKPVAVDAPGVRRILRSTEIAKQCGLAVGVGLQRRHERAYRETIKRLQDGEIGDIVLGRAYWNSGGVWVRGREEGQTELEYQMKNWYYFNWLCGDHITEQHIHNIDVINWLMDDFPVKAQGQGGRIFRTGIDHGEIYDHHAVEFTYANGTKMLSQCRHMPDCWRQVSEHAHGTKGSANISAGRIFDAAGKETFRSKASRGGHQQEQTDLIDDLLNGIIPNEGEYGAKSTMTSILGRLATYTGKELEWGDAINSNVSLADVDAMSDFDGEAPLKPNANGRYEIMHPGENKEWQKVIDWDPKKKKKREKKG